MDTTTARQEVAAAVRALMGRGINGKRVTQAQLGEVLGLSQGPVSERLGGKTAFDLDEMLKIAEHFGVSIGSIILEVDELRRASDQGNGRTIWEVSDLLAPIDELAPILYLRPHTYDRPLELDGLALGA